jgi:hypothetical protein
LTPSRGREKVANRESQYDQAEKSHAGLDTWIEAAPAELVGWLIFTYPTMNLAMRSPDFDIFEMSIPNSIPNRQCLSMNIGYDTVYRCSRY